MKIKKSYLIVIIVLVIYGFIFFVFVDKNDDKKEKKTNNTKTTKKVSINKKYLIVGDNGNFAYYNKEFKKATAREIEKSKKEFVIYSNNDYLGTFKSLQHVTSWNIFDTNNNYVSYDGNFFAYTKDLDISKVQGNFRELTDNDKNFISNKLKISDFDSLIDNQVYDIDLYNDNIEDSIINITNVVDDTPDKTYNLIILKINGSYKLIELNDSKQIKGTTSILSVFKFKDVYYITIEKVTGFANNEETKKTIIYKYDGKNVSKVITN